MIVTRVNSAFKKVFGYNNTDVLKHGPISDLFPQQELERIVKYHRLRFISPELVPSQYETQMIAKDKTVRDIIITVAVFPASRDKIISLLDITQRKRNEERLKHQQEQLEISQRELKAFSARLLQVREEEKKKIASDLHDEVGAMAVSLNTYLALAQADLKERDYENAIFHTSKIQSSLKHSIANLKRQAIDLRPPELDIIGLPTAMQQYSQRMLAKANIKVSFFMDIDEKTVSDASRIVLYRIAQEAVTNIIKHAQAKRVSVRLRQSGNNIYFTITDSGRGFSVKQLDRVNRGFGIRGMRERVESLGGIFDIYSKPRKGTRISVTLPILQEA
jgi:PAS domain S-box-containing protein